MHSENDMFWQLHFIHLWIVKVVLDDKVIKQWKPEKWKRRAWDNFTYILCHTKVISHHVPSWKFSHLWSHGHGTQLFFSGYIVQGWIRPKLWSGESRTSHLPLIWSACSQDSQFVDVVNYHVCCLADLSDS